MSPITVLVVHPEPIVAGRIAEALTATGHDVVLVPDGERAINRFIQRPTEALVVEMVLPGRDGATTVESIRWAPGGDRVAVILLGSRGSDPRELEEHGRRVHALAVLSGPAEPPAICSLVTGVAPPDPTRVAVASRVSGGLLRDARAPTWADVTTRPGDAERFAQESSTAVPLYRAADEELTGSWEVGDDPTAEREGRDVERVTTGTRTTQDEMEGDLVDMPFPRLLHYLAERRETGALVVTSLQDQRRTTTDQPPKKVVFFRTGVPIYVQSNLVQECLGQVLARGGHISQEVLAESVDRMRRGEGRQGGVLLAMRAIGPHELRDALEDQLRVKLFDLFAWSEGHYRFRSNEPAPRETVTLEMSLPAIVWKGVVHRIPPQRLLDLLAPELGSYVVPEHKQLGRFLRVEMPVEARRLLHSLDGSKRLAEVLTEAGNRPGAAAQLVYALSCVDAVTFADEPHMVGPLREDAEPEGSHVTHSIAVLREELTRLGRLLREERYSEALGIVPGDVEGAARTAIRLRSRYQPATEPGNAPRDLRALAYEVCARLVHAQEALSVGGVGRDGLALARNAFGDVPTRDERSKKDANAARGEPPDEASDESVDAAPPRTRTVAQPRITQPARPQKGVKKTKKKKRERERERAPATPELLHVDDGPSRDAVVPSVYDEITKDAPPDDGESTIEEPRESVLALVREAKRLSLGPSFEDTTAPDQAPDQAPEIPAPSLDEQVERLYQAERHFRRGERALMRARPEEAVEAFTRAVELCPDEGEFVAHLGYARYQAANGDDDATTRALAELARGAELAPKLDLAHLLRARVLAHRGEVAAARDSYGLALSANPDCTEALDGLRRLPSS